MYIHIGRTASTTASLKVSLASGSSAAKWNILTRQIECDTAWAAPEKPAALQQLCGCRVVRAAQMRASPQAKVPDKPRNKVLVLFGNPKYKETVGLEIYGNGT